LHGKDGSCHIEEYRYVGDVTDLVLLAKAMADPTRVRILSALRGLELCVCELCDALEVSQSTLSTHLQVIRDAGLVRTRKVGKWVYYAPAPDREAVTETIFEFFSSAMRRDARIRRDAERVKKRLAERDGGECCRGFEAGSGPKPKKRK
jgi:ArsR family transcriptional regulator